MSAQALPRTERAFVIPDHLWKLVEQMSAQMGVPSDMLVNQALFTLAQVHGYVAPLQKFPGQLWVGGTGSPAAASAPVMAGPGALAFAQKRGLLVSQSPGKPGSSRSSGAPEAGRGAQELFIEQEGHGPVKVSGERFVIGRGPTCNLVINSGQLSREHAAATLTEDGWHLEDLGSSNGTFQGTTRIKRTRIENGDAFRMGQHVLRFLFKAAEGALPPGVPGERGPVPLPVIPRPPSSLLPKGKPAQAQSSKPQPGKLPSLPPPPAKAPPKAPVTAPAPPPPAIDDEFDAAAQEGEAPPPLSQESEVPSVENTPGGAQPDGEDDWGGWDPEDWEEFWVRVKTCDKAAVDGGEEAFEDAARSFGLEDAAHLQRVIDTFHHHYGHLAEFQEVAAIADERVSG